MEQFQLSLVFFTVFTQWGIGSVLAFTLYRFLYCEQQKNTSHSSVFPLVTGGIFVVGSVCSLLHLGNPFGAYNALSGLGRSWLSMEVFSFSILNALMAMWVLTYLFGARTRFQQSIGLLIGVTGFVAIVMSGQIYFRVEHQPAWHSITTHLAFVGTALLLGSSSLVAYLSLSGRSVPPLSDYAVRLSVLFVLLVFALLLKSTGTDNHWILTSCRIMVTIVAAMTLLGGRPTENR